jgi:hypothetical protein
LTHLVSGAARSVNDEESPKKDLMYGTREWRECSTRGDLTALYVRQLRKIRDVVIPISIGGDAKAPNYGYDFIFAVRETGGGSEWASSVDRLRRRMEALDGLDVARVLRARFTGGAAGVKTRQLKLGESID